MPFTATDKQACAEREAKMRRRVYPRWVEQNRMSAERAKQEIDMMEEIAADYALQAEGERLL